MIIESELKFAPGKSKYGTGQFATKNIQAGESICIFNGERVDRYEINQRIEAGLEREDDPLQIGDNLYLDLDEQSNLFNHSCNPNAGVRGECELFAIKQIIQGDEITYDYRTVVGKHSDWVMHCSCGTEHCRGSIGSILSLPDDRLLYYKKLNALPDFILEELKILI